MIEGNKKEEIQHYHSVVIYPENWILVFLLYVGYDRRPPEENIRPEGPEAEKL